MLGDTRSSVVTDERKMFTARCRKAEESGTRQTPQSFKLTTRLEGVSRKTRVAKRITFDECRSQTSSSRSTIIFERSAPQKKIARPLSFGLCPVLQNVPLRRLDHDFKTNTESHIPGNVQHKLDFAASAKWWVVWLDYEHVRRWTLRFGFNNNTTTAERRPLWLFYGATCSDRCATVYAWRRTVWIIDATAIDAATRWWTVWRYTE